MAGVPSIWFAILNFAITQKIQLAYQTYPDEPWMWNPEWNGKLIESKRNSEEWYSLMIGRGIILGILIALINIKTVFSIYKNDPAGFITLGIILLAIGATFFWFYLHYFKFKREIGDVRLELDQYPLRMGANTQITLITDEKIQLQQVNKLTLEFCSVYKNFNSQGYSHWAQLVRWSNDLSIDKTNDNELLTNKVTATIEIPDGKEESNWYSQEKRFSWLIKAEISIGQKTYARHFEVPVFYPS